MGSIDRIELSDRAITALMRLEHARFLRGELRSIWLSCSIVTFPLMGAVLWVLFWLSNRHPHLFDRIQSLQLF